MRTISKPKYKKITGDVIFCGICGHKMPYNSRDYLMAYQLQRKGTEDYTIVLEYMCPECGFITNIRYDSHESFQSFLDSLNVYNLV
jgi:hypothetical protein